MLSKVSIVFILLFWSYSACSNNSAAFNYVNMYSSNFTNNVSIYSNGTMQAKITINYELKENYLIQNINLFKYEGGDLNNFKFFDNENSYPHEIESFKVSGKIGLRVAHNQYKDFYLTTRSISTTRVCAELKAINKLTNEVEQYLTCHNSGKEFYVTIRALQPKIYTINDFTLMSEEVDWYDGVMRFKKYEFIPKGWLLSKVRSNGSFLEKYNSSQIATHQLSYFLQDIEVDSSLTLYHDMNKNQQDMYVPAWAIAPNQDMEKLSDKYKFQINTNNKINLVRAYGFKIKDRNGDYGILAKHPMYGQEIRNITFYDYYGNEGAIYIKRIDDIDRIHGGNLENMSYGFY